MQLFNNGFAYESDTDKKQFYQDIVIRFDELNMEEKKVTNNQDISIEQKATNLMFAICKAIKAEENKSRLLNVCETSYLLEKTSEMVSNIKDDEHKITDRFSVKCDKYPRLYNISIDKDGEKNAKKYGSETPYAMYAEDEKWILFKVILPRTPIDMEYYPEISLKKVGKIFQPYLVAIALFSDDISAKGPYTAYYGVSPRTQEEKYEDGSTQVYEKSYETFGINKDIYTKYVFDSGPFTRHLSDRKYGKNDNDNLLEYPYELSLYTKKHVDIKEIEHTYIPNLFVEFDHYGFGINVPALDDDRFLITHEILSNPSLFPFIYYEMLNAKQRHIPARIVAAGAKCITNIPKNRSGHTKSAIITKGYGYNGKAAIYMAEHSDRYYPWGLPEYIGDISMRPLQPWRLRWCMLYETKDSTADIDLFPDDDNDYLRWRVTSKNSITYYISPILWSDVNIHKQEEDIENKYITKRNYITKTIRDTYTLHPQEVLDLYGDI